MAKKKAAHRNTANVKPTPDRVTNLKAQWSEGPDYPWQDADASVTFHEDGWLILDIGCQMYNIHLPDLGVFREKGAEDLRSEYLQAHEPRSPSWDQGRIETDEDGDVIWWAATNDEGKTWGVRFGREVFEAVLDSFDRSET